MSASDANTLFNALISGTDFSIPTIDLSGDEYNIPGGSSSAVYSILSKLTTVDVTSKEVNGSGVFDWFMAAYAAHLRAEYDANRITGANYTQAYTALAQTAMQQAVQFLLGKDMAFWQAAQAQAQTVIARVTLATGKMQYSAAQADAYTKQAQYALTKMQIPLVSEQGEVQRAQTLDTRTDGAAVTGVLSKQKDLLTQQRTSYMRDAETKAAKILADSWIAQKTVDEGLVAPTVFTNTYIDTALGNLIQNLDLD